MSARLEGKPVPIARELAMRTLLAGLYVSRYDIIYNVVEENLWLRLPPEYMPDFAVHLLGQKPVSDILDRYEVNGDFLDRETSPDADGTARNNHRNTGRLWLITASVPCATTSRR